MKNSVYTYNSELGDAFMNLYKKIHKIEKKTTTEEKIRIYTGITAVMPDELLEIKRVIDKMQDHTISMLDLGFNNETPMSPNYMMNVNAAENAIDDINAVAELFNFIRKKNNLPTDIDIPMSMIGELKSAFENHDFELFEKIAISNEYELGKMFAPPFVSPFDDLVKPCDTPATVEHLDDVFNDVEPMEPTNEPTLSESNEDTDVHELNDSVKESNIESSEESKEVLDPAVVMAYPTDMSVMINLIDELIAGFNTQSDDFINVLSKVNNKYKSNVTFGAAYIMMRRYNENLNLTIDNTVNMDTIYNICSEVFRLDNLNAECNVDGVPIESLSISDEVIGYICKKLLKISPYNTKYMIVNLVKNEFGIDVNIWEVAAISYVLINMLCGKYTINEGAALHPLMKNYRSLFNIPKSSEPIEPVIPEECITKDENKPVEVSEEPEELLDPNIVMAYPRDPEQINIIMNYLDAGFEVNGESITLIRKINKKYKTNITLNAIAFLNQSYLDNAKFSANINIKNTRYAENVFRMDSVNDDDTIDGPLPTTPNLSEEVLRYICDNLQGTRLCTKHGLVSCVKYEFGIEDINTWEVGAISYVMLNILGNKYITDDGNLNPAIKEYRKFFNIPKSEEPSTVKSRRRKKKGV